MIKSRVIADLEIGHLESLLIVDDDKSILRAFSVIFEKNGFSVETAETGRIAKEKSRNKRFDVVLLDLVLPDINGLELFSMLKNEWKGAIKVLFTGFPSVDNGIKGLEAGADIYLVKPVEPQQLLKLINQKLENRTAKLK